MKFTKDQKAKLAFIREQFITQAQAMEDDGKAPIISADGYRVMTYDQIAAIAIEHMHHWAQSDVTAKDPVEVAVSAFIQAARAGGNANPEQLLRQAVLDAFCAVGVLQRTH